MGGRARARTASAARKAGLETVQDVVEAMSEEGMLVLRDENSETSWRASSPLRQNPVHSSSEVLASSHTGVYGPKLQEYVSKKYRCLLVNAILQVIRGNLEEEKSALRKKGLTLGRQKGRWSACAHLAEALEVSKITIEKWLNDERRGCNPNIWKLIELGLEKAPSETIRLLEEDLESHRQGFLALLASSHTGVYGLNRAASVEVVA